MRARTPNVHTNTSRRSLQSDYHTAIESSIDDSYHKIKVREKENVNLDTKMNNIFERLKIKNLTFMDNKIHYFTFISISSFSHSLIQTMN